VASSDLMLQMKGTGYSGSSLKRWQETEDSTAPLSVILLDSCHFQAGAAPQ
jgi:hypothetical protein